MKIISARPSSNLIVAGSIGSGGEATERKELTDLVGQASSPRQIKDTINTLRNYMGAQLMAKRQEYEAIDAGKAFDQRLTPRARQVLQGETAASSAQVQGGAQPQGGWSIRRVQ